MHAAFLLQKGHGHRLVADSRDNRRSRTRPGSMTEKWPAQSSRAVIRSARRCPTSSGPGIGMRNRMMPHPAGKAAALANSPKSLSKVRRIRPSLAAHDSTSGSLAPGAAVLTHNMSCPADRSRATAAPGKFSLARSRISGGAWEDLLRAQQIPRVSKARDYVVMGNAGVVGEDVGFTPSIGHQADYELQGKPRATDHRLAGEYLRVQTLCGKIGHPWP